MKTVYSDESLQGYMTYLNVVYSMPAAELRARINKETVVKIPDVEDTWSHMIEDLTKPEPLIP